MAAAAAPAVPPPTSFATDLLAGSLGGMAGKLIEYPFDTLKVRLQTAYRAAAAPVAAASAAAAPALTPSAVLRAIVSADGLRGLYRGMSLPLAGTVLETATLFSANGWLKRRLAAAGEIAPGDELPMRYVLLAGAGTGFCVAWLLTPIELVKCRLQVSGQPVAGAPPGTVHAAYAGPLDCAARCVAEGGPRALFRGHAGTLLREVPGTACWFGAYESFLRAFAPPGQPRDALHPATVIAAGASGGMAYWAVMYPADTVKSAMQTGGTSLSFAATARAVYASGGLRALYAGATPTMLRAAPSNAAIFVVYEEALRLFAPRAGGELA
jgi:hypothetical protein